MKNLFDILFGPQQAMGHWDNVGPFGRLHTRSLPQMGCSVCEAEGWIPASQPAPVTLTTPDDVPDTDGNAYLSLAHADLSGAINWLALALKGRRDWQEALGLELDTLRGVLAAIEQEREVLP